MMGILVFVNMMESQPFRKIEQEGNILFVGEYRYLFTGYDAYYLRENFFTARFIGSGEQSEECHTDAIIESDALVLKTTCEGGVETSTIYLWIDSE
jgi:hypothetical protein